MANLILLGLLQWLAASVEYEFVPDTNRRVGIIGGGVISVGTLDADGVFHESKIIKTGVYSGRWFPAIVINTGGVTPSPVYEFRKGVLYPGTMRAAGPFVPDPHGTVVRFADYEYTPKATRIYNLPGYFRLVPRRSLFGGPPPKLK